jgi:ribosomal protein S10
VGSNPTSSEKSIMFIYLKASSKDQKPLEKFAQLFSKLEDSTLTIKCLPKKKKRKFVTVLKSPHVNKTAQEQFEFRFYNKQFLVNSFKPFTFLYFLKKIKNVSFSGIRLEIKILFVNHSNLRFFLTSTNPDTVILNTSNNSKALKDYISFFDLHGEVFLKKFYY